MRHLFLGTESPDVLSIAIAADGTLDLSTLVAVPATPNMLGLKHGGRAQGVNVEWLVVHPNSKWVYAFVSYWDKAVAEVVTFAVDETAHGALREVSRAPTLGYQAAHAELLPTHEYRTLAVAHYHSGSVTLFDVGVGGGSPTLVSAVPLPGINGVPHPLYDGSIPFKAPVLGSGEIAPHAHGVALAPASGAAGGVLPEGWVVVADAGLMTVVALKIAPRVEDGAYKVVGAPVSSPIAPPAADALLYGPSGSSIIFSKAGHRPRHVAFANGGKVLLVLHEMANAVSAHSFDAATGVAAPRHSLVGAVPERPIGCLGGCLSCLARPLPFPYFFLLGLAFGVAGAAEILVHAKSGRVLITNRGFGRMGSSLRTFVYDEAYDKAMPSALKPAQDLPCGPNPRHALLVSGLGATEVLLVSVTGGFDTFDVSDEGVVTPRQPAARLPGALAKLETCAVGVA